MTGRQVEVQGGAPTRPNGPLVWCHVPDAGRLPAALRLAQDLETEGDQITFLVTADRTAQGEAPVWPATLPAPCIAATAPADHAAAVRGFVDHWRPDVVVWLGGPLKGRTLATIGRSSLPMILADAGAETLRAQTTLWRARLPRQALSLFSHILCVDDATATRLAKADLTGVRVEMVGRIDEDHEILPCRDRDRAELAEALVSRPRWLAVDPAADEWAALAAAHRIASHRTHRLTLLVATEETSATAAFFTDEGFAVADRAAGDEPSEATEVLISDTTELGLFYRLSPVAFLGGTLATAARRNPFEAATLGSALLHGPMTAPYAAAASRLDSAGAARAVRSGEDLGVTLERLLSPDRAAQLARAAWDVASEGAEAANHLLTILRAVTDGTPSRRI